MISTAFRVSPRYAHSEGYTDLRFTEDGKYLLTCGDDGDIRIWKGLDDDDSRAECVGEQAFAIVHYGNRIFAGSDRNSVQILSYPEAKLESSLAPFSAHVTAIDISPRGSHLAAGSASGEVRITTLDTDEVKNFLGHTAPILCVRFDPTTEFLATSSCDGRVLVWDIEKNKMVKEWLRVIPPSNSFAASSSACHVSWRNRYCDYLAIPFGTSIKLFQTGSWEEAMTLTDPQMVAPKCYKVTDWSSCGKYLAAGGSKGFISVWDVANNVLLSTINEDAKSSDVCSLQWDPDIEKRKIVYCDTSGNLAGVSDAIPVKYFIRLLTHPNDPVPYDSPEGSPMRIRSPHSEFCPPDVSDPALDNMLNGSLDDFDNLVENYLTENDQGIGFADVGAGAGVDGASPRSDDGVSNDTISDPDQQPDFKEGTESFCDDDSQHQEPFQQTATPSHVSRRFMVYNDVGYVKQTKADGEDIIDVDFHDVAVHHSFRLNNVHNYVMASLSEGLLALAAYGDSDNEMKSKLSCTVLSSWDRVKEWTTALPLGEEIKCVAASSDWLALVSSRYYLRVYSQCGTERQIASLPGPVVTMATRKNFLVVAYHNGKGVTKGAVVDQNIAVSIYEVNESDMKLVVDGLRLPLSVDSTLAWLGFSDAGNICAADSSGRLRIFSNLSKYWTPICCVDEFTDNRGSRNFVIGVSEKSQKVRCLKCIGCYYPPTLPLPFITEIPWQIPSCDPDSAISRMEGNLMELKICIDYDEDSTLATNYATTALKLFAMFLNEEKEMRAVELCSLIDDDRFLDSAIKYASKKDRLRVAQMLNQKLLERKSLANCEKGKSSASLSMKNVQTDADTANKGVQTSITDPSPAYSSLIMDIKHIISNKDKKDAMPQGKINPFKKSSQQQIHNSLCEASTSSQITSKDRYDEEKNGDKDGNGKQDDKDGKDKGDDKNKKDEMESKDHTHDKDGEDKKRDKDNKDQKRDKDGKDKKHDSHKKHDDKCGKDKKRDKVRKDDKDSLERKHEKREKDDKDDKHRKHHKKHRKDGQDEEKRTHHTSEVGNGSHDEKKDSKKRKRPDLEDDSSVAKKKTMATLESFAFKRST